MNASRCTHWLWLDLAGDTFDCDLTLGHGGKHVAHTSGKGVGDRPRGGKARKDVGVRIEWQR